MTLVVNMVGGPGTGKSTTAAGVFFELKHAGVNCELIQEYAKDQVWGRTATTLGNQIYIFGKQYHRLWRLQGQVDVVITDAPIILSLYYGAHESESFQHLVYETFTAMDNYTFFLKREKAYNPSGRNQTESEAREIDYVLLDLLDEYDVPYQVINTDRDAPIVIAHRVLQQIQSSSWTSKQSVESGEDSSLTRS